jgi:pimeloyl-ACP methyl ester carboxylesterase
VASFCLIHGAWHGPGCWSPLVERLAARGHRAIAPDLPLHDPGAGYAERIRPALDALDAVSGPVVVVGHSLGSAYAPLIAARREGSLLVHLCPRLGPWAPAHGGPPTFREGLSFPEDRADGTSVWEPDAAAQTLYGRLPAATAKELAQRLRPLAGLSAEYPLARHPEIPTVLVYATEDELFEPDWELFMAREVLHVDAIEIHGGHFPMLEDPDALADLLERLAQTRPQRPRIRAPTSRRAG